MADLDAGPLLAGGVGGFAHENEAFRQQFGEVRALARFRGILTGLGSGVRLVPTAVRA